MKVQIIMSQEEYNEYAESCKDEEDADSYWNTQEGIQCHIIECLDEDHWLYERGAEFIIK